MLPPRGPITLENAAAGEAPNHPVQLEAVNPSVGWVGCPRSLFGGGSSGGLLVFEHRAVALLELLA
jgi:hypothetical protein